MKNDSNRINFLDVFRGLSIILIVIIHAMDACQTRVILSAFALQFFFFLSGINYKCKDDKKNVWKDKFIKIYLPYLSFSILSILVYLAFLYLKNSSYEISYFIKKFFIFIFGMFYGSARNNFLGYNTGIMIYNRPLWFLPCLLSVFLIVDSYETLIKNKDSKDKTILRLLYIVLCFSLGYILKGLILPFSFESAIIMASFFEIGLLSKDIMIKYSKKIEKHKIISIIITILFILSGYFLLKFNGHTQVRLMKFGRNYILMIFNCLWMIVPLFIVSCIFENNRLLIHFGKISMSVLLLHKFPIMFFKALPFTAKYMKHNNPGYILMIIIILFMCYIGDEILTRICPVIIGKKKIKKN
ncbi:Peptidoglycan/LPS O-acetylase OafA/YrhL, contains acyltransferase and SGNH-hydrolase domains [Lachnospiraceae bacterium RM5]|nr:Peptidoglycan/LPS O-acetylase OafA/YrhL, contains acyltransferase and SGNH-hydrolase domains [Lachnospiraceae bacterium RM5]